MKNQEIVRISIDLWHPIYKTGTIWKITQTYTHVCVSFCTSHTSSLSCSPPTLSPKMSQPAQSWRSVSVSYWSPWSSWSPSSTFSSHWVRIFLRSLESTNGNYYWNGSRLYIDCLIENLKINMQRNRWRDQDSWSSGETAEWVTAPIGIQVSLLLRRSTHTLFDTHAHEHAL